MIFTKGLKKEINARVISPSRSLAFLSEEVLAIAEKQLNSFLGINISYGENAKDEDLFKSSSIKSRIDDLHNAFLDKDQQIIFSSIGGYNTNQLLDYIDWTIIKHNPKTICGFSDLTALLNAIYAKTSIITYYGPHFSTFGQKHLDEYTIRYFKKAILSTKPYLLGSSEFLTDEKWYINQEERKPIPNNGLSIIAHGNAQGILVGGNLSTFCLLKGTPYMPSLKNCILMLEDNTKPEVFDRDLEGLLQLEDSRHIKGLLIGRFGKESNMTRDILTKIIQNKNKLKGIPIIADLDFGHTEPRTTLPIGGEVSIFANKHSCKIEILTH